jgi:hypothetical protein
VRNVSLRIRDAECQWLMLPISTMVIGRYNLDSSKTRAITDKITAIMRIEIFNIYKRYKKVGIGQNTGVSQSSHAIPRKKMGLCERN